MLQERGVPTGFNPLQLPPTETNIQFVEKLVKILVGGVRNVAEDLEISQAVRTIMRDDMLLELLQTSGSIYEFKGDWWR